MGKTVENHEKIRLLTPGRESRVKTIESPETKVAGYM